MGEALHCLLEHLVSDCFRNEFFDESSRKNYGVRAAHDSWYCNVSLSCCSAIHLEGRPFNRFQSIRPWETQCCHEMSLLKSSLVQAPATYSAFPSHEPSSQLQLTGSFHSHATISQILLTQVSSINLDFVRLSVSLSIPSHSFLTSQQRTHTS